MKQRAAMQLLLYFISILFISGCSVMTPVQVPALLKSEDASREQLLAEIDRFAGIDSMKAEMDLRFEDTSFAEFGISERSRRGNLNLAVQRPGKIFLKIEAPVVHTGIAHMTSDGEKFRVAILNGSDEYRKFAIGSNGADYSPLKKSVPVESRNPKDSTKYVNAFANVRPQHFADAILVRPVDLSNIYVQSELFQEESEDSGKGRQKRAVLRGYYILDEICRDPDGKMKIVRRFWFDRHRTVRLARQQIFDLQGRIDSDIAYSGEGGLSDKTELKNLPLKIEVTRPKDKYKISLSFQNPSGVIIGKEYQEHVFILENSWNLPELDLDQKLREAKSGSQR